MVGNESDGKITVTITGNSLRFHRDTDFWFETTFTLPAGTYPQQLHATIKDCPQPCDDIGKVVFAIFKIEAGTLTLVGIQATAAEPPKTFGEVPGFEDNRIFRYTLEKVQPSLAAPESPPRARNARAVRSRSARPGRLDRLESGLAPLPLLPGQHLGLGRALLRTGDAISSAP